jgi:hypothetical protein
MSRRNRASESEATEVVEEVEVDGEVITDVSEGGEPGSTRRLRVYDSKGDFIITIPSEAKVTFGYFNPSRNEGAFDNQRGGGYGHSPNVARQTALRIYRNEKQQLAVFLGVNGFRDESITLTRLRERVIIEKSYSDDGEGNVVFGGEERRQLVAAPEPDTYS